MARRVAMLERYLDVPRLFRRYTWRDLPTRHLRSYTAPEKIERANEAACRRTEGGPWRELFLEESAHVDCCRYFLLGAGTSFPFL